MIKLLIPFIGNVKLNHYVALNQLASCSSVQVNFITQLEQLRNKELISENIKLHDIKSVFKDNNSLGISLDGLISNPYKFCDLKPFYNQIFDIDTGDYWGFSDLDCLFNSDYLNKKFEKILEIKDLNEVYGNRGHLMIFGKESSLYCQSELKNVISDFREKGVNLLCVDKNYALDEFKFLHKILEGSKDALKWESDFFYPIMDIDYKNLIPKNLNFKKCIKFSNSSVFIDDKLYHGSYFHLQKRVIKNHFSDMKSEIYLNLDSRNGDFLFSKCNKSADKLKLHNAINFYLKAFFKRVFVRISNHGLSKRPSL